MIINYYRTVVEGCCTGYSYKMGDIELCCEDIKNDIMESRGNVNTNYKQENARYFFGFVRGHEIKEIKCCPYCGKPIIMNQLKDEIHHVDKDTDAIGLIDTWDRFFSFSFNEGVNFHKWKYEDK